MRDYRKWKLTWCEKLRDLESMELGDVYRFKDMKVGRHGEKLQLSYSHNEDGTPRIEKHYLNSSMTLLNGYLTVFHKDGIPKQIWLILLK